MKDYSSVRLNDLESKVGMRDHASNHGIEKPITGKNPIIDQYNQKDIRRFEHMQILERIKEKTEQIDLNKKIRDTHQESRVNLSDNVNTGKSRFYKRF